MISSWWSLWSNWLKKLMQRDELHVGRSLAVAAAVMVIVLAASVMMVNYINNNERQRCFDRLYNEAENISTYVLERIENDREELKLLAAVVRQYDDLNDPELWNFLESLDDVGMMSHIGILLPDNTVLYGYNKSVDASGQLSFDVEKSHGIHVSHRRTSFLSPDQYVLRHFYPIERNGQVEALLFGVIMIQELPIMQNVKPYAGKGAMYLIEGDTGNFLVDTWHPGQVGNLWALGEREVAPGYDAQQFKRNFIMGQTDYLVFISRTIGRHLYFHYRAMPIREWRIALSVPEEVVFESSHLISKSLNIFLSVEFLCFTLYLLWLINDFRKVSAEKQKRLDTIKNIHEIEQFLFNAHEKKENLYAAIEKLGKIMGAERINFWMLNSGVNHNYRWIQGQPAYEFDDESFYPPVKLLKNFAQGANIFESYNPQEIEAMLPKLKKGEQRDKLCSLMVVPVRDVVAGQLSGALAVCNLKSNEMNVPLLKALGFSFGMFCNNVKNRAELQEKGDRDSLTGMYNRNRYERDLPELFERYQDALSCIYIDVNGLREMNNTKGHDLGDIMLRTVAQAITTYFKSEYSYRVGGDEFVLFVPSTDEQQLTQCSEDMAKELLTYDYHVSVGIECEKQVHTIAQLIKAAEQKMYAQKRAFYATRERRVMHVA